MAFHSNRQRTDSVPQIQLQVVFQGKKKKGEAQNRMCQTLSSIFQQLWLTGNVIVDWNLANVQSIYKDWKENPDNYKSVSLTLVWEEVLEQRIVSAIPWHMQGHQASKPSRPGFIWGSCCLTNLISYDRVTHLEDERKAEDFSKFFDTVSHHFLLEKLAARGLHRCMQFAA